MIITDTIAAVATTQCKNSVGIVRISGNNAKKIGERITKKKLKIRYIHFSYLFNSKNEILDQGVVLYFKGNKSFTGEDIVELQAHGNTIILNLILQTVVDYGARIARPGEFTERAYLNGKIDLIQAEAVNEIIQASSEEAAKSALKSLKGNFSKHINKLVKELIELRSDIESTLNFPDENLDTSKNLQIKGQIKSIYEKLHRTLNSCKRGKLMRDGVHVTIIGEPNVGKSSLLNILTEKPSAIVTSIAGTTRDIISEYIQIDGIPIHITDTAGIRDSKDIIEKEGIKRTINSIKHADEILFVIDMKNMQHTNINKIRNNFLKYTKEKSITYVYNKIDLIKTENNCKNIKNNLYISIKNHIGINRLIKYLSNKIFRDHSMEEGVITARQRHIDYIKQSLKSMKRATVNLQDKNIELVAEDLRKTQDEMSKITGRFSSDDLLGEIFSKFCIGK